MANENIEPPGCPNKLPIVKSQSFRHLPQWREKFELCKSRSIQYNKHYTFLKNADQETKNQEQKIINLFKFAFTFFK